MLERTRCVNRALRDDDFEPHDVWFRFPHRQGSRQRRFKVEDEESTRSGLQPLRRPCAILEEASNRSCCPCTRCKSASLPLCLAEWSEERAVISTRLSETSSCTRPDIPLHDRLPDVGRKAMTPHHPIILYHNPRTTIPEARAPQRNLVSAFIVSSKNGIFARGVNPSFGVDDVVSIRTECDPLDRFAGFPDLPDFGVCGLSGG